MINQEECVGRIEGRIIITGAGDDAAAKQEDERNKVVIFKNCVKIVLHLLIVKVK